MGLGGNHVMRGTFYPSFMKLPVKVSAEGRCCQAYSK